MARTQRFSRLGLSILQLLSMEMKKLNPQKMHKYKMMPIAQSAFFMVLTCIAFQALSPWLANNLVWLGH